MPSLKGYRNPAEGETAYISYKDQRPETEHEGIGLIRPEWSFDKDYTLFVSVVASLYGLTSM